MREDQFMDRFSQDLDRIMEGEYPQNQDMPGEYQEVLALAANLSQLDFCPDELNRERKRQQLINAHLNHAIPKQSNQPRIWQAIWGKPALSAAAALVVLTLTLSIAFPGQITSAANNAADHIARVIHVGKYATVLKIDDNGSPAQDAVMLEVEQDEEMVDNANSQPDGVISVSIPGYETSDNISVPCHTGVKTRALSLQVIDPEYVTYNTLTKAQEALSFKILTPKYLPTGYSFKQAQGLKETQAYQKFVNLYYQGPGKDIVLMQRVSESGDSAADKAGSDSVRINDVDGVWSSPNCLAWTKAGVEYDLFANGISHEEALKIARSIE